MFIKRQVSGLKPETTYDLTFDITLENHIPPKEMGIGGSPGESVFFKVGAAAQEPQKMNEQGFYYLNVDKGEQSQGGEHALVIGNLANPLVNPDDPQFQPKSLTNEGNPLKVTTDSQGCVWLFVGTDSGFEGPTLYYIAQIAVDARETFEDSKISQLPIKD
jgi:hypothetical protein